VEVSGQLHSTAALPLGKEPTVTFQQEAGWAQSRPRSFAQEKKTFPLPGLESQIFKPNYAIPAIPHIHNHYFIGEL